MKNNLPFVSIVIPVLNGERTIRSCLNSLLHVDYPLEKREILVVDNGSTDRTAEIVKCYPVRYLREDRRGVSHARNCGIEFSNGTVVAFTDVDCNVTTGWLKELVWGFDSEDVGIVVGEVVSFPPKTTAERYMAIRDPRPQKYCLTYRGKPWFIGACFAVRRKVFEEIGLFDPQFAGIGAEDIDFSWRFFLNNRFQLNYLPKAVVFHNNRSSAREIFKRSFYYSQGQVLLKHKYPDIVSWSFKQEITAYKDIFLTFLILIQRAIHPRLKGKGISELSNQYFELVRKLGWRIGFTYGSLKSVKR